MLKRFGNMQAGSLIAFAVMVALAAAQAVPRVLSPARAAAAVGGCSSGMCSSAAVNYCPQGGDACGTYEACPPNPYGDMLCNPGTYCTRSGCTPLQGSYCN